MYQFIDLPKNIYAHMIFWHSYCNNFSNASTHLECKTSIFTLNRITRAFEQLMHQIYNMNDVFIFSI